MKDFIIISDGACDLSDESVSQLGVKIVPFYVAFEEGKYLREKKEVSVQDFYQSLIDNPDVFPKSSMPTAQDYYAEFEKAYNDDLAIICVTLTKKFSGSLNSALTAKDMFLEEHPDAKIEVIDSTLLSCSQGLLVREMCRMKDNGLTFEEIIENANRIKETGRCYFTLDGLLYLQHGGRIGKLTAVVGNLFKIAPLIVHKDGEIQSAGIAISRKRAVLKILDKFKTTLNKYNLNIDDYLIGVGYGYSKEEGKELIHKFETMFNHKVDYVDQIGATIAVHGGSHPLGIVFIKKYDR